MEANPGVKRGFLKVVILCMASITGYNVSYKNNKFVVENSSDILAGSLTIREISQIFFSTTGTFPAVDVKVKRFDFSESLMTLLPKIFRTESLKRCSYIPMWM